MVSGEVGGDDGEEAGGDVVLAELGEMGIGEVVVFNMVGTELSETCRLWRCGEDEEDDGW